MIRRSLAVLLALVAGSFAVTVHAGDLSYTFAELRFVDTEIGNRDAMAFRQWQAAEPRA